MIVPDTIIRSKRKTLSVRIDADARIVVRAPYGFPDGRIFSFLQEKEGWIRAQIQKAERAKTLLPSENLDGYAFFLMGKPVTVRLHQNSRILLKDGEIYLPERNAKKRLEAWLKENAKRIFSERLTVWAERMGTSYSSMAVSSARTRWGSCSAGNHLRFSYRLLYARKEAIDYVVVHELCHTFYKNHQKSFWAAVEKYCPDRRSQRRYLKENAVFMQIF